MVIDEYVWWGDPDKSCTLAFKYTSEVYLWHRNQYMKLA